MVGGELILSQSISVVKVLDACPSYPETGITDW